MYFKELGYISNLLSLSRIVLMAPIYYLMQLQTPAGNYSAAGVMVLAALTDAFDGRLARRLGQRTDLGRLLDPLADKIGVGIIMLLLMKMRDLPVWFVVLVVGRDLSILFGAMLVKVRAKRVVESNMLGKLTVNALALTILSYTLDVEAAKAFTLWLSVSMLVLSSASYVGKMIQMAKRRQ